MSDIRFTEDHEWIRLEDDGTATVGITDFAQQQLGDLVHVELPELEVEISAGDDVVAIESVKAASDIKAPVSGTITAVNETITEEPGRVNEDPTGEGWIFRMRVDDTNALDALMDESAYADFIEE